MNVASTIPVRATKIRPKNFKINSFFTNPKKKKKILTLFLKFYCSMWHQQDILEFCQCHPIWRHKNYRVNTIWSKQCMIENWRKKHFPIIFQMVFQLKNFLPLLWLISINYVNELCHHKLIFNNEQRKNDFSARTI